MKIKHIKGQQVEIPTASTADIAFLLIIFFMVTTVFRSDSGLKIILPEAEAARKIPARNISHLWVSNEGVVAVDDNVIPMEKVHSALQIKFQANPNIIVSVQMDKDTPYKILDKVFDELQTAKTLKVNLATKRKG